MNKILNRLGYEQTIDRVVLIFMLTSYSVVVIINYTLY